MHDRARAHRTRFLGNIKRAILQPPIAHRLLRRRQGKHFRMGSGILERFHLISGPCDDSSFTHHHGTYWHLRGIIGALRLLQCLTHEVIVAAQINDRSVVHAQSLSTPGTLAKQFTRRHFRASTP